MLTTTGNSLGVILIASRTDQLITRIFNALAVINARLLRLFFFCMHFTQYSMIAARGGEQRAALRHEGTNDVTLSRLGGHLFRH